MQHYWDQIWLRDLLFACVRQHMVSSSQSTQTWALGCRVKHSEKLPGLMGLTLMI